jgi:hypothetical protein
VDAGRANSLAETPELIDALVTSKSSDRLPWTYFWMWEGTSAPLRLWKFPDWISTGSFVSASASG